MTNNFYPKRVSFGYKEDGYVFGSQPTWVSRRSADGGKFEPGVLFYARIWSVLAMEEVEATWALSRRGFLGAQPTVERSCQECCTTLESGVLFRSNQEWNK